MDNTHPIWRSVAMRDALAHRDAGAIVRLARRAADITLTELGKQVGYTAASLSRMERGKQPMRGEQRHIDSARQSGEVRAGQVNQFRGASLHD